MHGSDNQHATCVCVCVWPFLKRLHVCQMLTMIDDTLTYGVHQVSYIIRDRGERHRGYWHQRADERHGNPPQDYQELLVVRDKVGRPPGGLG